LLGITAVPIHSVFTIQGKRRKKDDEGQMVLKGGR
jgi:hypothetical protein